VVVKLVEVCRVNSNHTSLDNSLKGEMYTLREIFVNPEHVVCIREDLQTQKKLQEGYLPDDLDPRQEFTRVYMNRGQTGLDITVIGAPVTVEEKLHGQKQLLHG
jgi:hypothetical protein